MADNLPLHVNVVQTLIQTYFKSTWCCQKADFNLLKLSSNRRYAARTPDTRPKLYDETNLTLTPEN